MDGPGDVFDGVFVVFPPFSAEFSAANGPWAEFGFGETFDAVFCWVWACS